MQHTDAFPMFFGCSMVTVHKPCISAADEAIWKHKGPLKSRPLDRKSCNPSLVSGLPHKQTPLVPAALQVSHFNAE